jgi:hypothetical protein
MKNFKNEQLTNLELVSVKGGREVKKMDHDGDGRWDEKVITRNDGSTKHVYRV